MPPLTPEEEEAIVASYYAGMQPAGSARVRPPGVTNASVYGGEVDDTIELPGVLNAAVDMGEVDPPRDMGELPGVTRSLAGLKASGSGRTVVLNDATGNAIRGAFSNKDPLFQNPLAPKSAVQDLGELGGPPVGSMPAAGGSPPISPTKSEDEALRDFVLRLESKKSTAAPVGGSGAPATKANPDPYGIRSAQEGQLHALDERSDALRRAADAGAVRAVQVADGQRDLARLEQEDAAIARAEGEYAQKHFDDGMQQIARELDDVRAKKIDPLRTIKESPALGILAVVGGALSGFYQGLTGGQENTFLKDLDHQIDRGIAEDERQIREEKFAINEAGNMLQQARMAHKDEQLAAMQYRNMSYEAAKQNIAAEASRDDIMVDKARADELIAQITFQQQQLAEEIGKRRQALAQSAAAGAYAHAKEVRDYRAKVYEKMLSEGYSPAQAEEESRRQVAVQYLPGTAGARPAERGGADPVQQVPKDRRQAASKELEAHANAEKSVAAIRSTFQQLRDLPDTSGPWDRTREALQANALAAYKSGLGPGMSSDKDAERFLDPLMPKYGESDATLAKKEALIQQSIRSKVATPTLDAHAPGWRKPTSEETKANLGARPVK